MTIKTTKTKPLSKILLALEKEFEIDPEYPDDQFDPALEYRKFAIYASVAGLKILKLPLKKKSQRIEAHPTVQAIKALVAMYPDHDLSTKWWPRADVRDFFEFALDYVDDGAGPRDTDLYRAALELGETLTRDSFDLQAPTGDEPPKRLAAHPMDMPLPKASGEFETVFTDGASSSDLPGVVTISEGHNLLWQNPQTNKKIKRPFRKVKVPINYRGSQLAQWYKMKNATGHFVSTYSESEFADLLEEEKKPRPGSSRTLEGQEVQAN
jgi:hypothetical protein